MKKLFLAISILLTASQSATAQLSTNQYKQVTTMISTATSPLKVDIGVLKLQVATLQTSDAAKATLVTALKDSISQLNSKRVKDSVKFLWYLSGQFDQLMNLTNEFYVVRDSVNSILKKDTLTSKQILLTRSGATGKIITMSIPDLNAYLLRIQQIEAILTKYKMVP